MSQLCNSGRNAKLMRWLEELFHNESIPQFEENDQVMESLTRIMSKNEEVEKDMKEIIKIDQSLTDLYNKKSEEISFFIDSGFISLSSETTKQVENVATLASQMNLKEPSLTNFLLAVMEAENKQMKNQEQEFIDDFHLTCLSRKVTSAMKKNESLHRDLKAVEESVENQRKHSEIKSKNDYFQRKCREYKYAGKKIERHLETVKYEPILHHSHLLQRAEGIKILENKIQDLVAKLNSYQFLPPDQTLTRLKVQEKKQELLELENQLQTLLNSAFEN